MSLFEDEREQCPWAENFTGTQGKNKNDQTP